MNTCGHLTARRLRSSATATSSISVARSMPFALIPASCSHSPLAYPAASHGEMRMERDEGRRPIRSVRDGSNEIRVGLDEHVPVPDGPDVFQILVTEFRRVGGTGPVERNSYVSRALFGWLPPTRRRRAARL